MTKTEFVLKFAQDKFVMLTSPSVNNEDLWEALVETAEYVWEQSEKYKSKIEHNNRRGIKMPKTERDVESKIREFMDDNGFLKTEILSKGTGAIANLSTIECKDFKEFMFQLNRGFISTKRYDLPTEKKVGFVLNYGPSNTAFMHVVLDKSKIENQNLLNRALSGMPDYLEIKI